MVSMPYVFSNELGGPVWAAVATLYALVIALAIFVCIDTFRPKRQARQAEVFEPRLIYAGLSAFYLLCVAGVWLPFVPRDWSLIPVLFTPLEHAIGTAYLLRIVYPAPARGAQSGEDDSASDAESQEPESPAQQPAPQ
jgi:hypothetical protein